MKRNAIKKSVTLATIGLILAPATGISVLAEELGKEVAVSESELVQESQSTEDSLLETESTTEEINQDDTSQKTEGSSEEEVFEESTDAVEEVEDSKTSKEEKSGLAIDGANFPDDQFRTFVTQNFDTDNNGFLSTDEVNAVTHIYASSQRIQNLTGIHHFQNLKYLDVFNNNLTSLDVSNLPSLERIEYSNNLNLKTLDFRNCPKLYSAHHSINQETVYISAGMLKYQGCTAINDHTGNLVIDLVGYYTVNQNGDKVVDLSTVLSPELLAVFEKNKQPGYDPATKQLIIPKQHAKSEFTAGKDFAKETKWTLYTKIGNVDDVTVTYESNGGTILAGEVLAIGTSVAQPKNPEKPGYSFAGWYTDKDLTSVYDFTSPVTKDIILYAKWEPVEVKVTVSYESNGGSTVASQELVQGTVATKPQVPTKSGYTFAGWYTDSALTNSYDFSKAVTEDLVLYAKWDEEKATTIVKNQKPSPTEVKKQLPKTGEVINKNLSLIGTFLLSTAFYYLFKKRR